MKMTLEQVSEILDAAIYAKQIYNPDYEELKQNLKSEIEKMERVAKDVWLSNRPGGAGSNYPTKEINELYWLTIQANTFPKLQRLLFSASSHSLTDAEQAVLLTFQGIYEAGAEVAEKLKEAEQFVIKGRAPSQSQISRDAAKRATSDSAEILGEALAAFRVEYRKVFVESYRKRFDTLADKLNNVDWDVNSAFPYPSSRQSKEVFVEKKRVYDWVHSVVETDRSRPYGGRPGDPHYVKIKPAAYETSRSNAIRDADVSIGEYVSKLAQKIGKDIVSAEYTGDLWNGSEIEVECEDRSDRTWHTRVILNHSKYGLLFNQWPTRRVV